MYSKIDMTLLAPIHSSLLYFGPQDFPIQNVDVEKVHSPEDIPNLIDEFSFKIFILHLEKSEEIRKWDQLLQQIKDKSETLQVIGLFPENSYADALSLFNRGLLNWILPIKEIQKENSLFNLLQKGMERHGQLEQESQKALLFEEQIAKLSVLKLQLESRVEKRHKYLERSQTKLAATNQQIELLHSSLIAVQQAQSVVEMEKLLFNTLRENLFLEWIKIFFNESTNLDHITPLRSQFRILELPIFTEDTEVGKIYFARDSRRPFRPFEEELLIKVTEAVSLAISRLVALNNSEELKAQWETTFDAFSEPLCLIDQNNEILRSNHAMVVATGRPYQDLLGKNPFDIMQVQSTKRIEDFTFPFRKRVSAGDSDHESIYDILCQKLTNSPRDSTKIIVFRDVTEETRLEKQALESSKMAELGIIGSSIAHELNNPIGGMLNFLQLMKMDLNESDKLYPDVLEMEDASRRCKDIIENLLGFARQNSDEKTSQFLLSEAIHHSLKLVEIQTKSLGIQVEVQNKNSNSYVVGNKNQIVQAFRNVLQNSIEAIERRRQQEPKLIGSVFVQVGVKNRQILVTIQDNGDGIPKQALPKVFNPLFSLKKGAQVSGLGLTVAFQIINRHKGTLELSSHLGSGTTARISMKSPEIKGSSQVFDTKI